jgi:hypothetical protein
MCGVYAYVFCLEPTEASSWFSMLYQSTLRGAVQSRHAGCDQVLEGRCLTAFTSIWGQPSASFQSRGTQTVTSTFDQVSVSDVEFVSSTSRGLLSSSACPAAHCGKSRCRKASTEAVHAHLMQRHTICNGEGGCCPPSDAQRQPRDLISAVVQAHNGRGMTSTCDGPPAATLATV